MKKMAHHLLIGPILVNPETSKRCYEVLRIKRRQMLHPTAGMEFDEDIIDATASVTGQSADEATRK